MKDLDLIMKELDTPEQELLTIEHKLALEKRTEQESVERVDDLKRFILNKRPTAWEIRFALKLAKQECDNLPF